MAYTGTFLFQSTDTGAPALSGEAGKLTDLLQAIFVDGYNSQSVTSITRSGSTATVTKVGHGFVNGAVVRNSGWDQAEYNIDAKITRIDADTYSYEVSGSPATPGTGSGSAKVCPLDWTAYGSPGTNHKAWQMPAICQNQFWLSVYDNGTTLARARGYETLTASPLTSTLPDADGTNPFPTNAQVSAGMYIDKSGTANSTARAWVLISDRKTLHLIINHAATTQRVVFSFGQLASYKSTLDSYPTYIAGQAGSLGYQTTLLVVGAAHTTTAGLYFARAYGGTAGAVGGSKIAPYSATNGGTQPGATASYTYPAPISGGLLMQRMICMESSSITLDPRGHWPGFWFPWHQRPLTPGDTFSGAVGSTIEGRSFLVVAGAGDGQIFLELRNGSYWD